MAQKRIEVESLLTDMNPDISKRKTEPGPPLPSPPSLLRHVFYIVLYCTILYYTVLYCTILYSQVETTEGDLTRRDN